MLIGGVLIGGVLIGWVSPFLVGLSPNADTDSPTLFSPSPLSIPSSPPAGAGVYLMSNAMSYTRTSNG